MAVIESVSTVGQMIFMVNQILRALDESSISLTVAMNFDDFDDYLAALQRCRPPLPIAKGIVRIEYEVIDDTFSARFWQEGNSYTAFSCCLSDEMFYLRSNTTIGNIYAHCSDPLVSWWDIRNGKLLWAHISSKTGLRKAEVAVAWKLLSRIAGNSDLCDYIWEDESPDAKKLRKKLACHYQRPK